MAKKQQRHSLNDKRIRQALPQIMLLLFLIQPVMDVISYWIGEAGIGNAISLLMRFAVFAFTAALGYGLSKRKPLYLLLLVIILLFAGIHGIVCGAVGYAGYGSPITDMINYVRVIQIPLFTMCFISFLRITKEKGYRMIERGFVVNFGIIVTVELLSAVTRTNPYTYANKEIGLLGWFQTPSAQSAIVSVLVPLVLLQVIRSRRMSIKIAGTAICFGVLYLFATRLAYVTIFICGVGFLLVMLMCRKWNRETAAILLVGMVICAAAFPVSPMYRNQQAQKAVAAEKQLQADNLISDMEHVYNTTVEEDPQICLKPLYTQYVGPMVDRFGLNRVLEEYNYTTQVRELKDWRRMKIMYCSFLMEDAGKAAKLFGLELRDMFWEDESYDVENDFHGMYFLYGAVGLGMFVLFLLYFAALVLRALIKDFKKYMTLEAGAFGIAFCTLLMHIYSTAGVLRRPNTSFYLSVVLAVIYYFVKIRKYPEKHRT